ncbi:hypothetical protein D3C85_1836100 [compost metagenome]
MLQHDIDMGVHLARRVEHLGQGGELAVRDDVAARQFFDKGVGHWGGPTKSDCANA